ncbi:aromatic-L-amino-acid decarboxylase-like isoform X1 [Patiria miniata]|uniref:Aromatic-L-amino-acid decarboxylase n=2 Tax=Patiria miniata TaxID=46514 RepID=A0A914AH28_PATMI|nr:aromatic-L-amino-acid decarboxylase-like isoform X1 [Patiria miniata]XP_038063291.1 aromatic-L-amino-acid decarboxylase-like isoform X1 [Patiria miniata]
MEGDEFRRAAGEVADFIVDYLKGVKDRPVLPSVEPGYLHKLLPANAPQQPEAWQDIMTDIQDKILPGMTHWQHPHFHAYFPGGNSYPSMLGELLTAGLGSISFTWIASPVMTELETVMIDWVGRMMDLPKELLPYTEGGTGGGVIQGSSSECTLVCMFAARTKTITALKETHPGEDDCILLSKLVAYFSEEAHSSVEKAANISFVKRRILPTDDKFSLRGETLREAVEKDIASGMVPFFVCATMGTTGSAAVDNIEEIGQVCAEKDLWLHVDGAYAGNALICPEYRYLLKGFQNVMSFNYNPIKWMHVGLDCSVMWVRNKYYLVDALSINRIYYMEDEQEKHLLDYRNWTVPLSRRFRSLKLWCVIRTYGVEGLQEYIRSHVALAKMLESWVRADDRFEVVGTVEFGLVCFRLKGENNLTEFLLQRINQSGKAHMVPASLKGKYVIRFTPANWYYSEEFTKKTWDIITDFAEVVLRKHREATQRFQKLLAKYKDHARARHESASGGDVFEEEEDHSWNGVLRKLGYRTKLSDSCGAPARRQSSLEEVPEDSTLDDVQQNEAGSSSYRIKRALRSESSFRSLSLYGDESTRPVKQPSETLFS